VCEDVEGMLPYTAHCDDTEMKISVIVKDYTVRHDILSDWV